MKVARSTYDPHALLLRAGDWLVEAERTKLEALRALCVSEAERCLELVQRSLITPVLRERVDPAMDR
jgi:hypothetical protein